MRIVSAALALWEAGQVSHHGGYSLERLCGYSEYAQRRSIGHVLAVCALSIAPPFVMVLLVDSIPLQDPGKGWQANWTLWVQVFIRAFCLSLGVALEMLVTTPAATLTVSACALIALLAATGYIVLTMPIAIFVAFPIPFMFFSTAGIWDTTFLLSVAIVVGPSRLKQSKEVEAQVKRFGSIMVAQLPMVMIYPALNALYIRVHGDAKMGVVLLLPLVKFLLKNLLARAATGLEDYVPTLVLSIDFFNTIYQSKCLEGAGSHWTIACVMLLETLQSLFSLHRLHLHVNDVRELNSNVSSSPVAANDASLLASVLEACEHPELLHASYLAVIPLKSCATTQFPHRRNALLASIHSKQAGLRLLSLASVAPLDLNLTPSTAIPVKAKSSPVRAVMGKLKPKNKIHAAGLNSRSAEPTMASSTQPQPLPPQEPREQKTLLLKKALQLLRRTEMLLLVKYVECAIPVLYASYLSILYYMPNAKYYPELSHVGPMAIHDDVSRILLYALLELLSLIWIHFMLKRRFRFSALHQLAFALEQDRNVVQGSFLCWTLIVFQFTMAHNGKPSIPLPLMAKSVIHYILIVTGVDFTFKFPWLHHNEEPAG